MTDVSGPTVPNLTNPSQFLTKYTNWWWFRAGPALDTADHSHRLCLPGGQQDAVGVDRCRTGGGGRARNASRLRFGGALLVAQIFHATCHHNRPAVRGLGSGGSGVVGRSLGWSLNRLVARHPDWRSEETKHSPVVCKWFNEPILTTRNVVYITPGLPLLLAVRGRVCVCNRLPMHLCHRDGFRGRTHRIDCSSDEMMRFGSFLPNKREHARARALSRLRYMSLVAAVTLATVRPPDGTRALGMKLVDIQRTLPQPNIVCRSIDDLSLSLSLSAAECE